MRGLGSPEKVTKLVKNMGPAKGGKEPEGLSGVRVPKLGGKYFHRLKNDTKKSSANQGLKRGTCKQTKGQVGVVNCSK